MTSSPRCAVKCRSSSPSRRYRRASPARRKPAHAAACFARWCASSACRRSARSSCRPACPTSRWSIRPTPPRPAAPRSAHGSRRCCSACSVRPRSDGSPFPGSGSPSTGPYGSFARPPAWGHRGVGVVRRRVTSRIQEREVSAAGQTATSPGRPVLLEADELRRLAQVSDARGVLDQALVWGAILLAVWLATTVDHWLATFAAIVLIGSRQNALATLAHEAWHRLAFSDGNWNHRIGAWLDAYPIGIPYHHDRRRHMRHHREVGQAHDPDWVNYTNEGRETPLRLARYLLGLVCGLLFFSTAWSVLVERKPRIKVDGDEATAARDHGSVPTLAQELAGIVLCQVVLLLLLTAIGGIWTYPLYWCVPLATFGGFFANLRAFLEHATPGDAVPPEARLRDFAVGPLEAFLISPCHFNYHALHHAFLAIPHRNLPVAKERVIARLGSYPLPVQQGYVNALRVHLSAIQGSAPHAAVAAPAVAAHAAPAAP
ncbi:MAG: hypothetical protein FJ148_10700, partial [Deltaproteobacteria bacterium]|nr:hypothetical protein [Deltaproteobacteria bacterium]